MYSAQNKRMDERKISDWIGFDFIIMREVYVSLQKGHCMIERKIGN